MAEKRHRRKGGAAAGCLSELFEPYVWSWFEEAFGRPSPPQEASWPRIAEGRNTLIFSPTGSGKTLAAFLWCLNELFRMGARRELSDSVYVLYLSPLKALNNDIQRNLIEPLAGIRAHARQSGLDVPDVRSAVRTGDTTPRQRAQMARRPPQILITTPESLYILLATQKFRRCLRTVRTVIVDEIHSLSDNKRGVHLSVSLERLRHLVGRDFVRIGLSATQKPLATIAGFLVGCGDDGRPRDCEIVDVGARKDLNVRIITPVDNLLEAPFDAIWGSAYDRLISEIGSHDTTLIFTNSRYKTERTALRLNELAAGSNVSVGAHHGSMSKEVRLDMEGRLKAGRLDALVATSSLELGIDVGSIDLVCQIQSPKSVSRGMQRIGRAGHLLDATSEGRLLVTDRDDLVESAVLVKGIVDGRIDTTRIPRNCLDVLAQQIVGAVAADDWHADDLFALCRRSFCYRRLKRGDFDRVVDMLAGEYAFEMDRPPFPKILRDKVNGVLSAERGSRMIAFRSSGTIPDVADYDVYFEAKKTKVGQLDEGFVEQIRAGDVFILGSSSWRVLGIRRNRVLVEDVYGRAPTIPFWGGERDSRTADLGALVGRFRREMKARMAAGDPEPWLREEYAVDENGAASIHEYFREQQLVAGEIPCDRLIVVEHFDDELGRKQIVIHSSLGIRVNETWALALRRAIEDKTHRRAQTATVDDGILLTLPKAAARGIVSGRGGGLLGLVTPENLPELLERTVMDSPVFASRFRHNAVRAMLILREYQGRRTPVWIQSLRAASLLEACRSDKAFPLMAETLRECLHEALDAPSLRKALEAVASGAIEVRTIRTKIPSPFAHTLLLLGQYGEMGAVPTRERRSRLMHLHRELLRQILDEETLRDLLDRTAVETVDSRLQYTHPRRRARSAGELARVLRDLGDLVDQPDEAIGVPDRCEADAAGMLAKLVATRRAVRVPLTTAETNRTRWIATENYALYRAAFGAKTALREADRKLLGSLARSGPRTVAELRPARGVARRIERLVKSYDVLQLPGEGEVRYVAADAWVPREMLEPRLRRQEARRELIRRFLRFHGPVTKYEIMERYALAEGFVEAVLDDLHTEGAVARGEYVPTKSFPQWCHKPNLEEIHRLTLNRLRREMEPAGPVEYADFLLRWQHVHPEAILAGIGGLREVLAQLQGQENFQGLFESEVFPLRVANYDPSMLDRLCYGGEVFWRRFGYRDMKRGRIGFGFQRDGDWVPADPSEVAMDLRAWDEDIPEACDAIRRYLTARGACFFDDVVAGTGLDERLALRGVWHLVWTGEATNDSYESIRHADFFCGLSACYDLATRPWRKGVTLDYIARHMLESRKLDPRLGRWAPTERLVAAGFQPPGAEKRAHAWAELLLKRYGIVCRDRVRREVGLPPWRDLRRALARLELLGKVRRGYFIDGLSGEQYAAPEAVEALREAKLRRGRADADEPPAETDSDEPMILLNACDPANPFGDLFPLTDEVGREVKFTKTAYRRLILQGGQPILLDNQGVVLLADLSRERAERAIRLLTADGRAAIPNWNGHPIDVSPARHLLTTLGFVKVPNRWKGFVYDGVNRPDEKTVAEAAKHVPQRFDRMGKEQAPVRYDAEWIVSRASEQIRPKVRELIERLRALLPAECEFLYGPRRFRLAYRGVRCVNPDIQQKKIWMQITHKGWQRGMLITPETDLNAPEFARDLLERFARTREQIDALLDRGDRR